MLFVQKLPTLEPEMRNALKHHIIRKRQRLKQEMEQDAIEKRLKKERELKQQQDAMTLDQIKEHLNTLEKKLKSLKDEKHDLFGRLKLALNDESNKRNQVQGQKQSSSLSTQELDESNVDNSTTANLSEKSNPASSIDDDDKIQSYESFTSEHVANQVEKINDNHNSLKQFNEARVTDDDNSSKPKQTSPINHQEVLNIVSNNRADLSTNNIYNFSINQQMNQLPGNNAPGTNLAHQSHKSSGIDKLPKHQKQNQQQNDLGPNNFTKTSHINNLSLAGTERPSNQLTDQQHDHPIHLHIGHKSQAISSTTNLNSRSTNSPRSNSTHLSRSNSVSIPSKQSISQQQHLNPHLPPLSSHMGAVGPYNPLSGLPPPYPGGLPPYSHQSIPTSMHQQSMQMDKQHPTNHINNNNNNSSNSNNCNIYGSGPEHQQRSTSASRHSALGPLGPLGALPPQLMGTHFEALRHHASFAAAVAAANASKSSGQHRQHLNNSPPSPQPQLPTTASTTPNMASLPPDLDHHSHQSLIGVANSMNINNNSNNNNNNNNNLNKNVNYLNTLNGLPTLPKRSSSMSSAEAVYLEELAVQAARKRQPQLSQDSNQISMHNNSMLNAASLYGSGPGGFNNNDNNQPPPGLAGQSSSSLGQNQQQAPPNHPGSPYSHLLNNLPPGFPGIGFPPNPYGQVSSANLTPTSMGLSIPTSATAAAAAAAAVAHGIFPHNHPLNNRKSLPYPLGNPSFDYFMAANQHGGKPGSALMGLPPNMSPFYGGGSSGVGGSAPPPPSSSAGPNLAMLSNPNLYSANLMPNLSSDSADALANHFGANSPYSQNHPSLSSLQQSFANQNQARLNQSNGNNNHQQHADSNRYLGSNPNSSQNSQRRGPL